jgi:dihydrofolate reductase
VLNDAAKDVARLKQEDGPPLITQGSSEIVHALLAAGLVDEIRVFTFPLLLGKGKRLFDSTSQPRAYKLTHSKVSPTGLIAAAYVPAGEVEHMTIRGAENPSPAELARREKLKREG